MDESSYSLKKQPLQKRSLFTVEVICEAATRILKEQGVAGLSTNAVAERAGVSIGSLYQYFGSKETLIAEIKRQHFAQVRGFFREAQQGLKTDRLAEVVEAFIDASVEAHLMDPELHRVLSQDLSDFKIKENDDSSDSILPQVEQVLLACKAQLREGLDIATAASLVYHVVEQTVHNAVLDSAVLDSVVQDSGELGSQGQATRERIVSELKVMVFTYLTGRMPD